MVRISFHLAKKEGQVTVRYRLRKGDDIVQISHRSDIRCDVKDLAKFNPDGTPKDRIRIYDAALSERLKKEYQYMVATYAKMCDEGMDLTSEVFEREIAAIKNPVEAIRTENPNIVDRFRSYADSALENLVIGEKRHKHIIVVADKLKRFLIIKGISGYKDVKKQNKPEARLSMNTVASQLKMFQTFFNELEDQDEIRKSPFRKLGRERKNVVMKTMYDAPIFLRKEELQVIRGAEVPPSLEETRDAFVVQCAFGCRISDYQDLSMESIAVSEEGIPYIHYIPKKTVDAQEGNKEVETPIVRFAFDIIKRTGFEFPILKNIYGPYGYNARIRALLQHCKIDRMVPQFNEETKKNDYFPLYKVASNKLARKTLVDLMAKVQVNLYAAGLHKEGSSAVERYTHMEIKDRFALMNAAFEQEPYIVDTGLNIL